MSKLQKKERGKKSSLRVPFNSSSEQYRSQRNKMWFTLSWPRRGFHHSVTVRMPTRSMVHETASFYWHGIQSVPLGYMSLALQWGPPITALPAPAHILLYAILFNPRLPSLRKYNQPCRECPLAEAKPLSLSSIVSDWLCRATITPSCHPSPCLWIPSELARCEEVLPHPSYSDFLRFLPTYTSPLSTSGRWQSTLASKRKGRQGGKKTTFAHACIHTKADTESSINPYII